MKNLSSKGFIVFITIIIALFILAGGVYFYISNKDDLYLTDKEFYEYKLNEQNTQITELMDLSLYIQDISYVATSSCSVTKKVIYKVPKTTAVADISLRILFSDELSTYGTYRSISIENEVAKIMLASDMTKAGYPISALSSCQSSHLFAVLKDTLTQYSSIKSIELLSPNGVIQF